MEVRDFNDRNWYSLSSFNLIGSLLVLIVCSRFIGCYELKPNQSETSLNVQMGAIWNVKIKMFLLDT